MHVRVHAEARFDDAEFQRIRLPEQSERTGIELTASHHSSGVFALALAGLQEVL